MRLKEDHSSWKSRGIMRRDFRHDPGMPETEVPPHRSKRVRRKHIKGCDHSYSKYATQRFYSKYICGTCGKISYHWISRYPKNSVPSPSLEGTTWILVERKSAE